MASLSYQNKGTAFSARAVFFAGLLAGTLDLTAAFILYHFILAKVSFIRIGQSIASGVYGPAAFNGGTSTGLLGWLFHYCIALIWAAIYFLLYPHLPLLRRSAAVSGIIYGTIVWSLMNLVVVPLSNVNHRPLVLQSALINLLVIIVCVGLPIAFSARKYYR